MLEKITFHKHFKTSFLASISDYIAEGIHFENTKFVVQTKIDAWKKQNRSVFNKP